MVVTALAVGAAALAATALPAPAGSARAARIRAVHVPGSPVVGKRLFKGSGCGSCHTLEPAGTTGTVGPNLDRYEPPYGLIVTQVAHGGGGMPAFGRRLSKAQIEDIAAFVFKWTSRP